MGKTDLSSYQPGERKILTKPKKIKKTKQIMIGLTEEETSTLRKKAAELGHNKLATFIRFCLKKHEYI